MATTVSDKTGVRRERMLVGGEWVAAADGRTFSVENPARRGSVIAEVPRASASDVDRAVRAAAAAFPAWRAAHWKERSKALLAIADDKIGRASCREGGSVGARAHYT